MIATRHVSRVALPAMATVLVAALLCSAVAEGAAAPGRTGGKAGANGAAGPVVRMPLPPATNTLSQRGNGAVAAAPVAAAPVAVETIGPSASLFGPPTARPAMTQMTSSWLHEIPREVRQVGKWDIITVVVSQQSVVISEGEIDRKKKAHGDLILTDWILLKNIFHMVPDPQSAGEPHIKGKLDNKLRSEATLETRDSMKFRMACHVVDIRPNGNLVIEGRQTIQNNEEQWDYALTGEVRPEDIKPDNSVLSENVADMHIDKQERGHVRDGYRRGWVLQWLDKWQPF